MEVVLQRTSKDEPSTEPELADQRALRQLFDERTVLLFGEIEVRMARAVCSELLSLAMRGPEPISVVLHSPGGHVESADSIFDMIRFVDAPVHILGTGWVASAGALIFAAVPVERRCALPNTRFLLHQPLGGVGGPATDVEIEANQVLLLRQRLNRIFSLACQQPIDKIQRDTERNHWLTTSEAVAYGLLGRVVSTRNEWNSAMHHPPGAPEVGRH